MIVLLVDQSTLRVKITDFGLATVEQEGIPLSSQCGTPNYGGTTIMDDRMKVADEFCDI